MSEAEPSRIDRFDDAVAAIEQPFTDLFAYSRRTRALIWALAASLLYNVVLSAVVGVFAVQTRHATNEARDAAAAADRLALRVAMVSCDARNEFKELDLKRWLYVLSLTGPEPRDTPAQAATRAARAERFRTYIVAADVPEPCSGARPDPRRGP